VIGRTAPCDGLPYGRVYMTIAGLRPMRHSAVALSAALCLTACAHGPPVDTSYRAARADELPERVAGDLPQLSDALKRRHAGEVAETRYRIYVDTDGAVRRVDVVRGFADADAEIVRALGTWRYTPRADRVRTDVRFTLAFARHSPEEINAAMADPPGQRARNLPPPDFRAQVVEEEPVIFPQNLVIKYANRDLHVVARLCADAATGRVNLVRILDGVPEAEGPVVEALKRWRVRPQPDGRPICTLLHIYYGGESYWVPR